MIDREVLRKALSAVVNEYNNPRDNWQDQVMICEESSIADFLNGQKRRSSSDAETGSGGVVMKFLTGGTEGGSYHEDSQPRRFVVRDVPDEFLILEPFLERYFPTISFLEYRGLGRLVETTEYTDYEYYGNSSDFNVMFLSIDRLADFLDEKGISIEMDDFSPGA